MKLLMRPSTGYRNKGYILTIFSLYEKFLSIKLVLRKCEVFQQTGARSDINLLLDFHGCGRRDPLGETAAMRPN